jgi:transposase
MERKRYSAEFKREAVKLASQPGMVKRQVAQELGIHENLLRARVRQFAAGKWEATPGTALKSAQQLENERLKRELKRVTTERGRPRASPGSRTATRAKEDRALAFRRHCSCGAPKRTTIAHVQAGP